MEMNKKTLFTRLVAQATTSVNVSEITQACKNNVFYVVAVPCISDTRSIGALDDDLPCLMATMQDALDENKDMIDSYREQIEEGERESDDEWEGEVFIARVVADENDENILLGELYSLKSDVKVDEPIHRESIWSMAGLI
jgi:hypothetical protein